MLSSLFSMRVWLLNVFFLLSAVFPRGDRHDLCTGLVLSSECNFSFFQYLYIFNERISLDCFSASLLSCFLLLIFILKSKVSWPVVSIASFSFFLCDTYIASWPHTDGFTSICCSSISQTNQMDLFPSFPPFKSRRSNRVIVSASPALLHWGDMWECQCHGGHTGQRGYLPNHGRARAEPRGCEEHAESDALLWHVRLLRAVCFPCEWNTTQVTVVLIY